MFAVNKKSSWSAVALLSSFLMGAAPSTSADLCTEAMKGVSLAIEVGDPKDVIAAVRSKENACGNQLDPVHGADTIAAAYIKAGDFTKALEYANKCLEHNYAKPNCHLAKIKALENLPGVKNFNEQKTRALTACIKINQRAKSDLRERLDELDSITKTAPSLDELDSLMKMDMSQMCIDSIRQIQNR